MIHRISTALSMSLLLPTSVLANQEQIRSHLQQAINLQTAHNVSKAQEEYNHVLSLDPQNFEAAFNAGNMLFGANKRIEAITYYQQALQAQPDCVQVHYNMGMCYQGEKLHKQALECFEKAITCNERYAKAYVQKAATLESLDKHDDALIFYDKAIELEPNNATAHIYKGRLLRHLEKFAECITSFRTAMALEPNNTVAILELANTLNMCDKPEECCTLYKRALEITPQATGPLYNYGYTLKKLGRIHEAIDVYNKVLDQEPNYALARFSRALAYLTLGDFDRGWQEYEWRWKSYNETPRKYKEPVLNTTDVAGKRIFLYAEQGLGDTFQFIRYAQLLKERGATVIFQTQKPLKTLLSRCPYIDQVVTNGDPLPSFDMHMPLMSLPLLFKTTVDTVPATIPYLSADEKLIDEWRTKLASDKNFKIGICWQGNPNYSTQFLRQVVAAKSMAVTNFAPIGTIPGVSLYSLQKTSGEDQLNKLGDQFVVHEFGQDFDDSHGRFMDTAAVIKNLDLVISVDTSICHFAAALGTPVWVPLPYPADWRWMLDRDDTPWYPNMRLFRQTKSGDWQPIMEEIANEVKALMRSRSATPTRAVKASPQQKSIMPLMTVLEGIIKAAMTEKNSPDELAKATDAARDYEHYRTLYPALDALTRQLLQTTVELKILATKLQKESVYLTQEYAELTRSFYYAYNKRAHIRAQIEALTA